MRNVLVLWTAQAVRRRRAAWLAGSAGLAGAVALAIGWSGWSTSGPVFPTVSKDSGPLKRLVLPPTAADLSIIFDTDVMPLAAEDARTLNEKRPIDVVDVTPARPFRIIVGPDGASHYDAALKCLAQAIYYEAASEPEAGQRAVAQVVLNRVKHPAFPSTICGVVYQGSERATGCQFTFTCDGSLTRVPPPALYRRAERIAREALAGRVATEVGNSTNYHADYVIPYWAPSLAKLTQIGRHIFYGLRGAIGHRSAFRTPYDLSLENPPWSMPDAVPSPEESPLPDPLADLPGALPLPRESPLTADTVSGSLIPSAPSSAAETALPSPLKADQDRGQLVDPGSPLDGKAGGVAEPR